MHTACIPGWGGLLTERPPLRQRPLWTETTPWTETPGQWPPSGQRPPNRYPPWTETGQRLSPRRHMRPGSQTGSDIIQRPPCGMTDTCENITLPQTSFAGGKDRYTCKYSFPPVLLCIFNSRSNILYFQTCHREYAQFRSTVTLFVNGLEHFNKEE